MILPARPPALAVAFLTVTSLAQTSLTSVSQTDDIQNSVPTWEMVIEHIATGTCLPFATSATSSSTITDSPSCSPSSDIYSIQSGDKLRGFEWKWGQNKIDNFCDTQIDKMLKACAGLTQDPDFSKTGFIVSSDECYHGGNDLDDKNHTPVLSGLVVDDSGSAIDTNSEEDINNAMYLELYTPHHNTFWIDAALCKTALYTVLNGCYGKLDDDGKTSRKWGGRLDLLDPQGNKLIVTIYPGDSYNVNSGTQVPSEEGL